MVINDAELQMINTEWVHALHVEADADRKIMRMRMRKRPTAKILRSLGLSLMKLADRIAKDDPCAASTNGIKAVATGC